MLATVSFPIYMRALVQRDRRQGAEVARHRLDHASRVAVQLHDPAGAAVRVPAADLVRGDLAERPAPGQLTLATTWNITNTIILGAFMVVALGESRRSANPHRSALRPPPRPRPWTCRHPSPFPPRGERSSRSPTRPPEGHTQGAALRLMEVAVMTWAQPAPPLGRPARLVALVVALTLVVNQRSRRPSAATPGRGGSFDGRLGVLRGRGAPARRAGRRGRGGAEALHISSLDLQRDLTNGLQRCRPAPT